MTGAQIERLIELTGRGLSAQDVAEELCVTDRTVYRYLAGEMDHRLTECQAERLRNARVRFCARLIA